MVLSEREFNVVVRVMNLLRTGKITSATTNKKVAELVERDLEVSK